MRLDCQLSSEDEVNGMESTEVTSHRLLYGIRDGGSMVGLSRSTLYQLMAAGELPYITYGRRRLIAHQALVDLAERIQMGQITPAGNSLRHSNDG